MFYIWAFALLFPINTSRTAKRTLQFISKPTSTIFTSKQNLTCYFIKPNEDMSVMFILQSYTDCSYKMSGKNGMELNHVVRGIRIKD